MSDVERLVATGSELGEGPFWHPDEQALYWVNIPASEIHRLDHTTGKHEVWNMAVMVTVFGLRESGDFVVGTSEGFSFWPGKGSGLSFVTDPEEGRANIRFNDGAVDPAGRFWAGTLNMDDARAPHGVLYRLDPDGTTHRMDDGFTVSNGLDWSPDLKTMYFTDSLHQVIYAYDYDNQSGAISNRRVFVDVPEKEGVPDGLTVDAEGYVWSTRFGGWAVMRYDPSGKKVSELKLPVSNVTSCVFGGPNLDELYISTAIEGLSEEQKIEQPMAGDLFIARPGVFGREPWRFKG